MMKKSRMKTVKVTQAGIPDTGNPSRIGEGRAGLGIDLDTPGLVRDPFAATTAPARTPTTGIIGPVSRVAANHPSILPHPASQRADNPVRRGGFSRFTLPIAQAGTTTQSN